MRPGVALLDGLSIVTLNSWAMKGMSNAFMAAATASFCRTK